MTRSYKLWLLGVCTEELQLKIYYFNSLACILDLRLQQNGISQENRFTILNVLRLNHHVGSRKKHADEMRNECIEDVAIHHTIGETHALGKACISMKRIQITRQMLEGIEDVLGNAVGVFDGPGRINEILIKHIVENQWDYDLKKRNYLARMQVSRGVKEDKSSTYCAADDEFGADLSIGDWDKGSKPNEG